MNMLLGLILFFLIPAAVKPSLPIQVDGKFSEWEVQPDFSSLEGPFVRVDIHQAGNRIFWRWDLRSSVVLQKNNDFFLIIDSDNDPATGKRYGALGAEIIWEFGARRGEIFFKDKSKPVNAYDLGLIISPTHRSKRFELSLDTQLPEIYELFSREDIKWGLGKAGKIEISGELKLDDEPLPAFPSITLKKEEGVRLISYNVLRDGFVRRPNNYDRILRALNPDVVAFQEMKKSTPSAVIARFKQLLGGNWEMVAHSDLVVVSRYPILRHRKILGNLAVVIDLKQTILANELCLINLHLPSGKNEKGRQWEADSIIAFLRDVRPAADPFISSSIPIVILGDFNLVVEETSLTTLKRGKIINHERFGADYFPDGDKTELVDLEPRHCDDAEVYTWWHPGSSYPPGRLDFILYTDSILRPAKSFILRTESMAADKLNHTGLIATDTSRASDHLPLVVDFIPRLSP